MNKIRILNPCDLTEDDVKLLRLNRSYLNLTEDALKIIEQVFSSDKIKYTSKGRRVRYYPAKDMHDQTWLRFSTKSNWSVLIFFPSPSGHYDYGFGEIHIKRSKKLGGQIEEIDATIEDIQEVVDQALKDD